MIKFFFILFVLLPIIDIILLFILSNYISWYFIIFETFFTISFAFYIIKSSINILNQKQITFNQNFSFMTSFIFRLFSSLFFFIPGLISDFIAVLFLLGFFQNHIKNYFFYKYIVKNFNNNDIVEGSFINKKKEFNNE